MVKTLSELAKPEVCAVIVVDLQNDFCHNDGVMAKQGRSCDMAQKAAHNTAAFLEEARKRKVRVIFIRNNHNQWNVSQAYLNRKDDDSPKPCEEGTWGEEFFVVSPLKTEAVVVKHRYSAFIGTDLDVILRSKRIQTLIMTGVATGTCVESTARDGFMMDYNIVVLSDCTGARSPEVHNAALNALALSFGIVTTSKELLEAWSE